MAFIKSSLPTMSTRNDWRPGMSNAFTTPSSAASTKISRTVIRLRQRQRRQHKRQQHGRDLRTDHNVLAVAAVGHDSAERRKQEHRNLAGKSHCPQLQPRAGQPVDQPRLGHGLHPGADQRNELSAEKKLEVAMPQRASGRLPAQLGALGRWCAARRCIFWDGKFRISHVQFFG